MYTQLRILYYEPAYRKLNILHCKCLIMYLILSVNCIIYIRIEIYEKNYIMSI